MIELLLVLTALGGPGVQAPEVQVPGETSPAGRTQELSATERSQAALRRDPRSLPKAVEGRWKDFDAKSEAPAGMREAVLAMQERDLPRALDLLFRVLETEAEYPPALYQLGVVYFRLQRYGDGVAPLERFIAVAPALVGVTRVLGHCYYSLGEYARAKQHYERVLALAPKEVEALRGLALCEFHLGAPEAADALLGKLLEIDPNHAEAWIWKAQVLFELDRPEAALAASSRARELDPWQPRPWFLSGRILLDLGREEEGIAAEKRYRALSVASQEVQSIENRLEYAPHQVVLLQRLVEIHESTGNVPAARAALARLAKERPADIALRILTIDVLERMGDPEGARVAAETLASRFPEEWRTWQRLERYYARTGQREERLKAGDRFRRLKPD